MPPRRYVAPTTDPQLELCEDWAVSYNKHRCASIILWGMPRELSTLEIRGKLADIGLRAYDDSVFDGQIQLEEIAKCVWKLKNNKTAGSDGMVGELLKYGGSGMIELLQRLFSVIWHEEIVPPQWREGLIVNLFKKGDKEDPGNLQGYNITYCCRESVLYNNK